ncbi:hypothetical protein JCM5353_008280 [Sporobolomyces roseus]
MPRVIKVEVGDGGERRIEKMRVGSVPYERVLQDVEAMYNMPRGTCRLYLVDRNGEEVAIGATSWDDLELSEDIRARFYVSLTSPRQRSMSPSSTGQLFDFDPYSFDRPNSSRSRQARSPSPGFDSFSDLLPGRDNPRSTSNSRPTFHNGILQSPRAVSFDMTGLEEDKENEDFGMNLDDPLDAQNHRREYHLLYADSSQSTLSDFDHTHYSEQNQLPTPASSPAPHEQPFDRSRSSSRRSSYSHYTSTFTSHSPTLANSRRSPSTSSQSLPVSTQTSNEPSQNEILTRASMTAVSNRQALSTSPRRPASPARDISPRSSSSSRRIASPRPSLELTPIHTSLPSSTTLHSMPARRQFSQNDYISTPKHCARSPERWC